VATFAEQGLPSVDAVLWFAVLVPAGTPPAIVQKLHADFAKVSADPEYSKALETRGLEVRVQGPESLGAFMERDYLKFRDLIQKLGLKPE
jgi:tripartite-type tricarboxylate transporter receptor subunit TctC